MCTAKSIHIDGVQDLKEDEWQFVIDVNLTGGMALQTPTPSQGFVGGSADCLSQ